MVVDHTSVFDEVGLRKLVRIIKLNMNLRVGLDNRPIAVQQCSWEKLIVFLNLKELSLLDLIQGIVVIRNLDLYHLLSHLG